MPSYEFVRNHTAGERSGQKLPLKFRRLVLCTRLLTGAFVAIQRCGYILEISSSQLSFVEFRSTCNSSLSLVHRIKLLAEI